MRGAARRRNLLSYKLSGRRPWTQGYFEYKWQQIEEALHNPRSMAAFREDGPLPSGFGVRIDERIVEYPWLLAHMPEGPARLLDAGSALNFETIITHSKFTEKKVTIANLNPEPNCFWKRGISYVFEDIRALPFLPESFDLITCISTLEHVGMDNKIYTKDASYNEKKAADYIVALEELKRVLAPGGVLFLTVPFGKYGDFGFFQQFDSAMLVKVVAAFGPTTHTTTFYRYGDGGWQIGSEEECASAAYVTADMAKTSATLPAAAGAVACLTLTK